MEHSWQLNSSCCEECLLSSNFINNLQHIVHDHIISVLRRKYSFDYFHCFTMSLSTSSNGSLVFVNSHENPVFKHIHIVAARKLIWIYSPIHMMAPGDNPGPTGMSSGSASRMSCVQ